MLHVELVPRSSWGDNLRSRLDPAVWDRLRKACYIAAGHKCEICGGTGARWPVECHEVWDYDDTLHVQKLVRLIALCPACHEVKHFGRARVMGNQKRALQHLCVVNDWTVSDAEKHLDGAFATWRSRSEHTWALDLSFIEGD